MVTPEIADKFDRILKQNNDYFWDKPDVDKIQKDFFEYTEKYVKLAPRWIALNDAFKQALEIIANQQAEIKKLTAEVNSLRTALNESEINNITKENA